MGLNLNEYLKDLEYLINIDSGTSNLDGNRQIAAFFAKGFRLAGFDVSEEAAGEAGRPVVIAKTPDAASFDSYLGGHMDTVFPDGTAAARPFTREGDIVTGPGTVDMKAGALLILHIARELRQSAPEIPLCIVLNSDEEIGSPDSAAMLRREAANCRRIFIFEGGRKEDRLVNQRKGIAKYRIEIQGIASHAGTAPWKGASAVTELAHWITRLDKLKNYDRGTSINVGLMEGGTALNVVAPSAWAMMEVRYTDQKELARVQRALEKMTAKPFVEGTRAKVTQLSHYPPLLPTAKTLALMEELAPYGLEYVKAGGISDANRLADLDIPIIDGCGPGGGFPHSEKEFLSIQTVRRRFDLFTRIIKETGIPYK